MLHGGKPVVDALLAHPEVRAISFVGSTPVAKYIYAQGAVHGKRVQCQGGAKNHVLVLDDADMETSTRIISDSAFGCAGQRCLAVSVAVVVGDAQKKFKESIVDAASAIHVGNGLEDSVQMGPVITPGEQVAHRELDRERRKRRRADAARRPLRQRRGKRAGKFPEADDSGQCSASSSLSTTESLGLF